LLHAAPSGAKANLSCSHLTHADHKHIDDISLKLACMDSMAEHMLTYHRDVMDPIPLLLLVDTTLPCRFSTV